MKKGRIQIALFGIYCALMLWLLFARPGFAEGIPYADQLRSKLNLIPFRTLRLFVRLLDSGHPPYVRAAVINLAGNVVMFIPLGIFLPRLWEGLRRFRKVLLSAALIIIAVELIQLFTLVGSCDIDDLILNLIGTVIGYAVCQYKRKPAP